MEIEKIEEKITKKYGTSYYIASLFFKKEIKKSIFKLYRFVRELDEIVDTEKISDPEKKEKILNIKKIWDNLFIENSNYQEKIDYVEEAHSLFIKYNIPKKYGDSFFESMIQDTYKKRYSTINELLEYCYGSASVVGIMITYIVGFIKNAPEKANTLGNAMQLTNFLRDIKEDVNDRDRIYIPLDELQRFNITYKDIKDNKFDEKFKSFMMFQIERNKQMYKDARPYIFYLNKSSWFPIFFSSFMYEEILNEIKKQGYNIFKKRARVSFIKKILLIIKTKIYIWKIKK